MKISTTDHGVRLGSISASILTTSDSLQASITVSSASCVPHNYSRIQGLNTYSDIRAEEIAKMVNTVWRTAQQGDVIDVRTTVTTLNNNILCRMLFGETHLEVGDLSIEFNEGSLKALMDEVRDLAGEYYNDLIPGRKWLDMGT